MSGSDDVELVAPFRLQYAYKRSTGPVIGRFLTALRDGRLEGVRCRDGFVLFPSSEADPRTGHATGEPVTVGPEGTVHLWTWVPEPLPSHPIDRPFAWATIQLDGADTPFVHAVLVDDEAVLRRGLRVCARFRDDRVGSITDLEGFLPVEGA